MALENILVEIDQEGIALLVLNRPAKLNALNQAMLQDLDTALAMAENDSSIRALVITGAGDKSFVAGADIAELSAAGPLATVAIAHKGQRIMRRLETMGKPSVAAINGFAFGGGLELAMCCTIRIASRTAKLGQPEAKLGMTPGYGGSQRLPQLVGRGRALEMLLTAQPIEAEEAWRIGLVNQLANPEELLARSRAVLSQMLANGPMALRLTMEAVDIGCNVGMEEGLRFEAAAFGLTAATHDSREGTQAFLERRPPQFTGK